MNINQVKYFVTVYEQGSISTAARGHNVSAQAVSKAISDLEREYGQKLFDRANSGVSPTVQGRAFYQKAKVAARAYTDLETMSFGGGLPEPKAWRRSEWPFARPPSTATISCAGRGRCSSNATPVCPSRSIWQAASRWRAASTPMNTTRS